MAKKLLIANMPFKGSDALVAVLFSEGSAVELRLARRAGKERLGDIYLGRVEVIKENIDAAFVRVGEKSNAFLRLDRREPCLRVGKHREGPLSAGDELLVQIAREASQTKQPRLSPHLVLSGTWLVLTTERIGLRFSSRIPEEDRAPLYEKLRSLDKSAGYGAVLRTNAPEATADELAAEYRELAEKLDGLRAAAQVSPAPALLHRGADPLDELFRALPRHEEVEIITDDPDVYESIREERNHTESPAAWNTRLYEDKLLPLYKLGEFEKILSEATARRVWLRSGAYLVIEQTEAFVSVDVNTGKNSRSRASESAFLEVNREALCETARQIRLRELSGTILIDFINMKSGESRKELFALAQDLFRADPARAEAVDFTALGILEVTRQRSRPSLAEQLRNINDTEAEDDAE